MKITKGSWGKRVVMCMHTDAEWAERKGYLNVVVKDEYRKPQRFYETT